jgi:hypothetical protein
MFPSISTAFYRGTGSPNRFKILTNMDSLDLNKGRGRFFSFKWLLLIYIEINIFLLLNANSSWHYNLRRIFLSFM